MIFKPEVLSLMYFSFSHSGNHFCNPSKLFLTSTASSGKDCEEDHVMNHSYFLVLNQPLAGFIQCCLFYRYSIMDIKGARAREESAHVESEGGKRQGQF